MAFWAAMMEGEAMAKGAQAGAQKAPGPKPGSSMGGGLNSTGNYSFQMGQNQTPWHTPMTLPEGKNKFWDTMSFLDKYNNKGSSSTDNPSLSVDTAQIPQMDPNRIMKKLSMNNLFQNSFV